MVRSTRRVSGNACCLQCSGGGLRLRRQRVRARLRPRLGEGSARSCKIPPPPFLCVPKHLRSLRGSCRCKGPLQLPLPCLSQPRRRPARLLLLLPLPLLRGQSPERTHDKLGAWSRGSPTLTTTLWSLRSSLGHDPWVCTQ